MNTRRSFVDKRDTAPKPQVKVLQKAGGRLFPAGAMLIASPLAVREVVAQIPTGALLLLSDLRQHLALRYGADYTCPLTTGIFLRIMAEAAEEEGDATPYWRVVRDDGRLIDKLPGGAAAQARKLMNEGVPCRNSGRTWRADKVLTLRWRPAR
ncbi:MAG: MGMT family protein [Bryobacterales bacterium]|nr:MGMT family protein [Bryobacterales bacterium]